MSERVKKISIFDGTDYANSIVVGDCLEILPQFPADSFDLVFADPPYNLQLKNALNRPVTGSEVMAVNDAWDKFSTFEGYDQFTECWLTQVRRIMKPDASLWVIGSYHNIFRVGKILQDLGFWIINDVQWIKTNPMPNFRGVRLANATETLIWAVKDQSSKAYTFHYDQLRNQNQGKQMRSDWYFSLCNGDERIKDGKGIKVHSTQKPLKLLERIVTGWSNEGDSILDPFGGSGTTGEAAWLHNRKFTLIEKSEEYVDWALTRFETKQHSLFG